MSHGGRSVAVAPGIGKSAGERAEIFGGRGVDHAVALAGELSDRETGESTLLFEPALSIIEGVEKADRLDMVNRFLIDRWRPQ